MRRNNFLLVGNQSRKIAATRLHVALLLNGCT